jgi:hypothetical protein
MGTETVADMGDIKDEAVDYHIGVHDDPAAVDATPWDALLSAQAQPTPFLSHAYLSALHASGSAAAATGWLPQIITIHQGGELVGATVAWLKSHSYGEYVGLCRMPYIVQPAKPLPYLKRKPHDRVFSHLDRYRCCPSDSTRGAR